MFHIPDIILPASRPASTRWSSPQPDKFINPRAIRPGGYLYDGERRASRRLDFESSSRESTPVKNTTSYNSIDRTVPATKVDHSFTQKKIMSKRMNKCENKYLSDRKAAVENHFAEVKINAEYDRRADEIADQNCVGQMCNDENCAKHAWLDYRNEQLRKKAMHKYYYGESNAKRWAYGAIALFTLRDDQF